MHLEKKLKDIPSNSKFMNQLQCNLSKSNAQRLTKKKKIIHKDKLLKSLLSRIRGNNNQIQFYHQKLQKINNFKSKIQTHKIPEFICPLCLDYYIKPINTNCGHTFCCSCLQYELLVKNICPICQKTLNDIQYNIVHSIESIIKMYITKQQDKSVKQNYSRRLKEQQQRLQYRQLDLDHIQAHQKIDIRCSNLQWDEGQIIQVLKDNKNNKVQLLVKYKSYERLQIISGKSKRLAKLGFYTNNGFLNFFNKNDEINLANQQFLSNKNKNGQIQILFNQDGAIKMNQKSINIEQADSINEQSNQVQQN